MTQRHLAGVRRLVRACAGIALFVAIACSGDDPVAHVHDDVFRVALAIGPDEIAATGHLPITAGSANRVGLNLYSEHGARITVVDHFQITVAFTPTTVASATQVPGTTTFFDITSSQPPDTEGTMIVTIYHPHTEVTKSFGPYDILIH